MAVNNEDYAIVIGINKYPYLRPLFATHRDATAFMEWLLDEEGGGLPKEHIRLFLSPETLPPDRHQTPPHSFDLDGALADFGARKNQRIGRRLYFYFAGHGFGPTFDDVAMVLANAALDLLNRNIGLRPFRQFFHRTGLFDEVVFILDCCRSSTDFSVQFQLGAPGFTPRLEAPVPQNKVRDYVVLAAAWGEKAFEPTDKPTGERRGLLTKVLLKGLREGADHRGRITSASLRDYVLEQLPKAAGDASLGQKEDARLRQKPEIPALPDPEFVFGAVAQEQQTVRVRIVAPSGLGGELVLRDSRGLQEIERRAAADVTRKKPPWERDLARNQWYALEHTESPPGTPPAFIDLRKAKDETYVYQFRRPK